MKKQKQKLSKQQNKNKALTTLNSSAKNIGVALISAIIGEIIDKALERWLQKTATQNGSAQEEINQQVANSFKEDELDDHSSKERSVSLRDRLEEILPVGKDLIDSTRLGANQLSPILAEFVDILKDTAQQKIQESVGIASHAAQLAVDNASSISGSVMNRVNSADGKGTNNGKGTKLKKDKKSKRKKHLKKEIKI